MKYILISDFDNAEEVDDSIYAVRMRVDSGDEKSTIELFSEGDIFKIRKRKPAEADAITYTDDWVFCDSGSKKIIGYVFRD